MSSKQFLPVNQLLLVKIYITRRNGLPKLVQPTTPSVLIPLCNPIYAHGIVRVIIALFQWTANGVNGQDGNLAT